MLPSKRLCVNFISLSAVTLNVNSFKQAIDTVLYKRNKHIVFDFVIRVVYPELDISAAGNLSKRMLRWNEKVEEKSTVLTTPHSQQSANLRIELEMPAVFMFCHNNPCTCGKKLVNILKYLLSTNNFT